MTDPQVFYNREALRVSPNETYAGQAQPMVPRTASVECGAMLNTERQSEGE